MPRNHGAPPWVMVVGGWPSDADAVRPMGSWGILGDKIETISPLGVDFRHSRCSGFDAVTGFNRINLPLFAKNW